MGDADWLSISSWHCPAVELQFLCKMEVTSVDSTSQGCVGLDNIHQALSVRCPQVVDVTIYVWYSLMGTPSRPTANGRMRQNLA